MRAAKAYSWHAIRIGLACALRSADCPDAIIQLICRWSCPESLHVYAQMGISKNVFWTDKAQTVTFDALRVNNLPRLDNHDDMRANIAEFAAGGAATPQRQPSRPQPAPTQPAPIQTFKIHGGTVQASIDDADGLVGLRVPIINNFWRGYEDDFGTTVCPVVARCVRDFLHADGQRSATFIIEWSGIYFPIKREALLTCLTAEQRRQRQGRAAGQVTMSRCDAPAASASPPARSRGGH